MRTLSILTELFAFLMFIIAMSGFIYGNHFVAGTCGVLCGAFLFVHKLITKIQ